jgi:hypothetical protein
MNTASLAQLQHAFLQHLFDAKQEAIAPWIAPDALTPAARLDIYRNNVFSNFRNALEAVYPVVLRLVGEEFFHHAARHFIRRYPSQSGDIHHFGSELSEFLASFPGAVELGYLPDVARLEWAVHEVFHGGNSIALELAKLQDIPPERYGDLSFKLAPALRLVESPYPIQRIWQVNQPEFEGEGRVELDQGAERCVVKRRNFVVEIEVVSAAEFALLRGFAQGLTLGEALDQALVEDENVDPGAMLGKFALQGIVTDFVVRS